MKFLDSLRDDLNSSDPQRIQYALLAIYWIADFHMCGGDPNSLLDDEPYRQEIIEASLNKEFILDVKEILREFLTNGDKDFISSAISILGKFSDPGDINRIEEILESSLQQLLSINRVLHQSIIALSDLTKIDTGSSQSLLAIENSVDIARNYLQKQGKEFPW